MLSKIEPPFRGFKITLRFTPVSKSYPKGNILIFYLILNQLLVISLY